jgi:transcriptional regulator with XRE-family HTH domain
VPRKLASGRTTARFPEDPLITRLVEERKKRGWTQGRVARRIGVGQSALSAWERRINDPTLTDTRAWCAALDMTMKIY